MARPGQIVPRAPADAEHGATAELQRVAGAIPARPAPQPQARQVSAQPPSEPVQLTDDLNDGYDAVLFGPSQRPDEPITEGAPFGPGSNFVPRPFEDDRAFMLRVADEIERSPGGQTPSLAAYTEDIRRGR